MFDMFWRFWPLTTEDVIRSEIIKALYQAWLVLKNHKSMFNILAAVVGTDSTDALTWFMRAWALIAIPIERLAPWPETIDATCQEAPIWLSALRNLGSPAYSEIAVIAVLTIQASFQRAR